MHNDIDTRTIKEYDNKTFESERALYAREGLTIKNCRFDGHADGESPLKESKKIKIYDTFFNLRYPLWHSNDILLERSEFSENSRAPIWYSENILLKSCNVNGIKTLRESNNIYIQNSKITSSEFAWKCNYIKIEDLLLESEYAFFESSKINALRMKLTGKYSFQYIKDAVFDDCLFDTKDAFWHSENVTIKNSIINGEYLGWYSKHLHLINCHITGTQPLCYCKGLILKDCTMDDCDFAFEKSEVSAAIKGHIKSIRTPIKGSAIFADSIGKEY